MPRVCVTSQIKLWQQFNFIQPIANPVQAWSVICIKTLEFVIASVRLPYLATLHPYPLSDQDAVRASFYGFGSIWLCLTPAAYASLSCGTTAARPQLLTLIFTHSDPLPLSLPRPLVPGIGSSVTDMLILAQDGVPFAGVIDTIIVVLFLT